MPTAAPTARIEAHISTEPHAMLKRAAEIQSRSLTDFVVSAVREAAQRAIEQGEVVRLSLALERVFARRCTLLRSTSKAQVKTLVLCVLCSRSVADPTPGRRKLPGPLDPSPLRAASPRR